MNYETLYKRTSTGAIQEYNIAVAENNSYGRIIKLTGQLGGKLVRHEENVTVGKQKRTAIEQAHFQAKSDWKRKHDEGYKSAEELCIDINNFVDGVNQSVVTIEGEPVTLAMMLENLLPKFNTDAAGELLPMLAKSKLWEPGSTNFPQIAEIKYDGNRSTFVLDLDKTYALSRTGKPQKNLEHLIAILEKAFPLAVRRTKIILDGEVYLHGLLLEEINEAIKKANDNTPKLQFVMYDVPLYQRNQISRSAMVRNASLLIDSPFFPYSVTKLVYSDQEIKEFHDECVVLKYEGVMVKNPESHYQPGQRSSDWKKVKVWDDTEFLVVGYSVGQRGVQDLKFICESKGGQFEATMNGTIAQKQKLYDKIDDLIGKMLTVQHKGYTKYGIPNLSKGKLFREE